MFLCATSTSLLNISRNDTAWAACSNVWKFFPLRNIFLISNLEKSQWTHQLYEVLNLIKIWITALLFFALFQWKQIAANFLLLFSCSYQTWNKWRERRWKIKHIYCNLLSGSSWTPVVLCGRKVSVQWFLSYSSSHQVIVVKRKISSR